MEEVRFLDLETNSSALNMATDESIMLAQKRGEAPPTLRLYRWKPSAVSIGTFQSMEDEVDVGFCKRQGMDYIRRITGGGAVYHDYEGEITYSIIFPKGHRLVPDDIIDSYRILCGGVIKALERMDVSAEFKPINDIVVNGVKVSGNAQTRRHSCVLQHGTVLLDLDVRTMFQILKVPAEKISDKMISDVRQRVTSIRHLLERKVSFGELRDAMVEGFSEALNVALVPGALSKRERDDLERLTVEKYATDAWNMSR